MKTISGFIFAFTICSGLLPAADQLSRKLTYEKDDAVWIANIDGASAKKIAGGQSPDLSPDGTKLAYNTVQESGQPAHRQLAVTDLASGKTTILKDIPSDNCMSAHWSPDGQKLLFEFYVNNERRIGVISADGSGFHYAQESEPKHKDYWSETWSADGKSFFAQDMENLYLLDLDAKVLKKWQIEKLVPRGSMSGDVRLDASPDGKYLLMDVEMDEKERKGWDGPPAAIWKLDLTTEKATRLTPKTLYGWDSHWLDAPDSILFVSQNPGEEAQSIYRMSATGDSKDRKLLVKNGRGPGTSR
jgi:TolB protein